MSGEGSLTQIGAVRDSAVVLIDVHDEFCCVGASHWLGRNIMDIRRMLPPDEATGSASFKRDTCLKETVG